MTERTIVMDTLAIQKAIPHRYPFLLVDRVVEFNDAERIVGLKNVSSNEEFFLGHFPGRPVMPGVLIIESMTQTGALLAITSSNGLVAEKIVRLDGVKQAKFKRQVVPGDTLIIEMKTLQRESKRWVMEGTVTVDGVLVSQAIISLSEAV